MTLLKFHAGYLLRMLQKIFVGNLVENGGHFAGKRYIEIIFICFK